MAGGTGEMSKDHSYRMTRISNWSYARWLQQQVGYVISRWPWPVSVHSRPSSYTTSHAL